MLDPSIEFSPAYLLLNNVGWGLLYLLAHWIFAMNYLCVGLKLEGIRLYKDSGRYDRCTRAVYWVGNAIMTADIAAIEVASAIQWEALVASFVAIYSLSFVGIIFVFFYALVLFKRNSGQGQVGCFDMKGLALHSS